MDNMKEKTKMNNGNVKKNANSRVKSGSFILGFLGGILVTAFLIIALMPKLMIVTKESRFNFDDTVEAIEKAIPAHGWTSPGTMDMNKALAKNGVDFLPRVKLIKLCHAVHAKKVLTTDRYISSIMPCTVAVWEDDDGGVKISKMNMALMAKLFGGNVGKVMGGDVAKDEAAILEDIIKH